METLQQSYAGIQLQGHAKKSSLVHRFFNWCNIQEKNRLGWIALIIAGHGCIITPITLGLVVLTGNNFVFWPFIIAAMGVCLVTNLAAMPTKITIPAFFISLLVDLVIIANCLAVAINIQ